MPPTLLASNHSKNFNETSTWSSYGTTAAEKSHPQEPKIVEAFSYQASGFPEQSASNAHFGGSVQSLEAVHGAIRQIKNIGKTLETFNSSRLSARRFLYLSAAWGLGIIAHKSEGPQSTYGAPKRFVKSLWEGSISGINTGNALGALADDLVNSPNRAGPAFVAGGAAVSALLSAVLCAVQNQGADALGQSPSIFSAAYHGLLTGVDLSNAVLFAGGKLMGALGRGCSDGAAVCEKGNQAEPNLELFQYQAAGFPNSDAENAHFGGSTRSLEVAHAIASQIANFGNTLAALQSSILSAPRLFHLSAACALGILAHRSQQPASDTQSTFAAPMRLVESVWDGSISGINSGSAVVSLAAELINSPNRAGPAFVAGGAAASAVLSAALCAMQTQGPDALGQTPSVFSAAYHGLLTGVHLSNAVLSAGGKLMAAMGRSEKPEFDVERQ